MEVGKKFWAFVWDTWSDPIWIDKKSLKVFSAKVHWTKCSRKKEDRKWKKKSCSESYLFLKGSGIIDELVERWIIEKRVVLEGENWFCKNSREFLDRIFFDLEYGKNCTGNFEYNCKADVHVCTMPLMQNRLLLRCVKLFDEYN